HVQNDRYRLAEGHRIPADALAQAHQTIAAFCIRQVEQPVDQVAEPLLYALRYALDHGLDGQLIADARYATACRQAGSKVSLTQPEVALALFEIAVSTCRPSEQPDKHQAWGHLQLAHHHYGRGRAAAALASLDQCLPWFRQHDGGQVRSLVFVKSQALRSLERYQEALDCLDEVEDEGAEVETRRIPLLLDLKRAVDVLPRVRRFHGLRLPIASARLLSFWLRRASRQLELDGHMADAQEALSLAARVLESHLSTPELVVTRFQQALLADRAGDGPAARRHARHARTMLLARPPGSALALMEALREGGRWYRQIGHRQKALRYFRAAVRVAQQASNPALEGELTWIQGQVGLTLLSLGRVEAARAAWRDTLRLKPAQEWVWFRLVGSYQKLREPQVALQVLQEACQHHPHAAWIGREQYDLHWRLGDMGVAESVPADALRRARALLALNRPAEALALLEGADHAEAPAFLAAYHRWWGDAARADALAAGLEGPRQAVLQGRPLPVDHLPAVVQARLQAPRRQLHALYGWRPFTRIRLIPMVMYSGGEPAEWLSRATQLALAVAEFHRQTFPGTAPIEVDAARDLGKADALDLFWSYRELTDPRIWQHLPRRQRQDIFLVVCGVPGAECSGVAPTGAAFVLTGEHTIRAFAVAVHEFYHALLDLPHTDGLQDESEPQSVMGGGSYTPLPGTWVSLHQRALCLTVPGVSQKLLGGWRREAAGDLDLAHQAYSEALAKDPLHLQAWRRTAHLRLRLRGPVQAMALLRDLPVPGPQTRLLTELGADMARLGHVAAAARVLGRVPGAGKEGSAEAAIGRAWMRGRCYGLAMLHLFRAMELEPSYHTLVDMAIACQQAGRRSEACRLFRAALSIYPESRDVWCRLAGAQAERGRFPLARRLLRKAARVGPKPRRAWLWEAIVDCLEGRWPELRDRLERDHRKHRKHQYLWWFLGYVRWSLGDEAGAQELFLKLSLQSFHPEAELWLAWLEQGASDAVLKRARAIRRRGLPDLFTLHLLAILWPERYARSLQKQVPHHPRIPIR
ncbi:MAG TPA: tetratricopeptide repeat protein, partial [Candidatus Xenobia bacterium]